MSFQWIDCRIIPIASVRAGCKQLCPEQDEQSGIEKAHHGKYNNAALARAFRLCRRLYRLTAIVGNVVLCFHRSIRVRTFRHYALSMTTHEAKSYSYPLILYNKENT